MHEDYIVYRVVVKYIIKNRGTIGVITKTTRTDLLEWHENI